MKVKPIDIETVAHHLKITGSAVSLPFSLGEYQAFHVTMDEGDERKLILWWENEKETKDLSCRLVDSNEGTGNASRVDSFMKGDGKQFRPADLRILANKEPVAVTDELQSDFWYLIDGSHRSIAQFRSQKSFQNVKLYVCVHPNIKRWPYVPNYYKQSRQSSLPIGHRADKRTQMEASCGHSVELYWIKDEVWLQIPGAKGAQEGTMTQCLDCAQKLLGRPFTLHDLSVPSYLRTKHMPRPFMKEYARAVLCGAYAGCCIQLPEGWSMPVDHPHIDSFAIGKKLAEQTDAPGALLPSLIAEWQRVFAE